MQRSPLPLVEWLDSLPPNTQRSYRAAWDDLLSFTGKSLAELTAEDTARWLGDLAQRPVVGVRRGKRNWQRRGYAETTIAQWCSAISAFYASAYAANKGWHNPILAIARPKVPSYLGARFLTLDEIRALLRAVRKESIIGRRNYILILILIITGRRSSEVCRMRWGDLRRDGERVWWLRLGSVGGEAERLPPSVWRAITDYLTAAGRLDDIRDEDFIFTAVTSNARRLPSVGERAADEIRPLSEREVARLVKRYAQLAGLDPRRVTPTTLRHTAAKLRREAGDSVSGISALLGISTASTHALLRRAAEAGQGAWVRVEAMLGL
jgi:integrase